jgi:hypothetical protein
MGDPLVVDFLLQRDIVEESYGAVALPQGWMEVLLNRSCFDGSVSIVFMMKGKSLQCANKDKGLPLLFSFGDPLPSFSLIKPQLPPYWNISFAV